MLPMCVQRLNRLSSTVTILKFFSKDQFRAYIVNYRYIFCGTFCYPQMDLIDSKIKIPELLIFDVTVR